MQEKEGRKRSDKGIVYPFDEEISKLDNKMHLKGVDFDTLVKDYKIIVMNHQPGIGKTHTVMDYIMKKSREDDNFTFFYFTDRHKTIDEHLKRLKKEDRQTVETFAHWKGFGKHCTEHPKIDRIEKLLAFNIPIDTVKKLYDLDEIYNKYKDQFKNTKRVFAPFQYLSNEDFLNNPPKIAFLDERISQLETYGFNSDEIAEGLELIKAPPEYIEHARLGNKEDKKFFWNKDVRGKIEYLYNKAVITAIQKRRKYLDKYKKLNPYKLLQYLTWSKIYNYEIDTYSFPYYYKALDVITTKKVPIVIMDATFNRYLFSYFLESYNGEMSKYRPESFKGFKDLRVKVLSSNVTSNKSKIYRMHPKGAWPKRSFTEYKDTTWEWLLTDLHELRKIFGDANIGIITYKELSWLFEAMNFDVEYFGNLRGTNKLENKIVLVIVGTWLPLPPSWIKEKKKKLDEKESKETDKKKLLKKKKDYIDKLVEKYFMIKITKKECNPVMTGAPLAIEENYPQIYFTSKFNPRIKMYVEGKIRTDDGLIKYHMLKNADRIDEFPLSTINTMWCDEIYQAFHRNRGLRYRRYIFAYAWFPEPEMNMQYGRMGIPNQFIEYNLRDEFEVVEKVLDDDYKERIFSELRANYKGGIMQELMKHIELNENVDDIADMFHIYTKGAIRSWNTKPITALKRPYKELKDLVPYRKN